MSHVPPPKDGWVTTLERVTCAGRTRWRSVEGHFFEWDSLHGEFEAYNKRGRHIGVFNSEGSLIKAAVPGRRIDV